MEVGDQLHAPAALSLGKKTRYALDRRVDLAPRVRLGIQRKDKSLLLPRIEPRFFGHPAASVVIIPIGLSRLLNTRINSIEWRDFYIIPTVYIHITVHRNKFLFNNQQDAPVITILFCYKILHVSGAFSAHHLEFSTAHSALVSIMQVSDDRFQAESRWLCLEAVIRKLHDTYQCRMCSRKLLMMGRERARNM
jgi:hypothetical protein